MLLTPPKSTPADTLFPVATRCRSPAAAFGLRAVVSIIRWLGATDPGPNHSPVDIGGGSRLPVYVTGSASHAWWAMIVLLIVVGMILDRKSTRLNYSH